ncbi:MAG TPA: hypothetical protein P5056_03660 [Candidatus Paceibacterota bacterium]|nr:hypothetical protein [Candidatus Paceibacterota bacterium]
MISEANKDGKEMCPNGNKWSWLARIIGKILAILFALFVGIAALGYYWPTIQEYRYKMEAERFMNEINAEKARILALEKADTFGGKTPEETFDMFLNALKAGDTELASKYYDVTVQSEVLEGLKKELSEKGNLDLSIKYFTDVRGGEKKCSDIETDDGGCVFEYIYTTDKDETVSISGRSETFFSPKGSQGVKAVDFKLIAFSKIWKITQPF